MTQLSAQPHYYGINYESANIILLPEREKKDILIVGDSFPAGARIRSGHDFPSLIQKMTRKKVVNLAVGATGPIQYNRMIEVGMQYDPDLVIYCLFSNDFIYYEKKININKLTLDNSYLRFPSDLALFTDHITTKQRILYCKDRIADSSILFRMVKALYMINKLPPIMKDSSDHQKRFFQINKTYFHLNSKQFWDRFISWDNEDVLRGFKITISLVRAANLFVTKNSKKFLVILIPSKEMVYSYLIKENRLFFDDSHINTYNEFESEMNRLNIPVVNSLKCLVSEAGKGNSLYFPIDGHFNENGHKKMAEVIFRQIQN